MTSRNEHFDRQSKFETLKWTINVLWIQVKGGRAFCD